MAQEFEVNNEIYHELGDQWYTAHDNPVALLRAEGRLKNPWVVQTITKKLGPGSRSVLDIGCGAGYLVQELERAGHRVTGIDLSQESLDTARRFHPESCADYLCMSAYELDRFAPGSFDVICAMDFLEHVDEPERVIAGAARVLKPGGLFFFHTFNRNWLSRLIIIKGVEWFVRNTPERLHIYSLFIKPSELASWCHQSGFTDIEWTGIRPKILSRAFLKLLRTGTVDTSFGFTFTKSLALGYAGVARLT
ncbi:MAG: bifunctional 2-polyprenyl-6-hydroxyphenol methylase/3-demethylubiquinol 3-O-methyltransferase UbiG [Bdellovibrionia bacterium]